MVLKVVVVVKWLPGWLEAAFVVPMDVAGVHVRRPQAVGVVVQLEEEVGGAIAGPLPRGAVLGEPCKRDRISHTPSHQILKCQKISIR